MGKSGKIKDGIHYDAIIVGSGIGGLVCGCLLAKIGYKTLILEQHSKPGGYVTSYKRGEFTFDVPHVIGGFGERAIMGRIVRYLGMDKDLQFIKLEPYQRYIMGDVDVKAYSDLDVYEKELLDKFPEDKEGICKYFHVLKKVSADFDKMLSSRMNLFTLLLFPFLYPSFLYFFIRYRSMTINELLDKYFKNEKIKNVLSGAYAYLGSEPNRLSAVQYILMVLSYSGESGAWYPKGGYQVVADKFSEKFKQLGGDLVTKSMVEKIIINKKKATGVEMKSGEKYYGKYIISNADTKQTFLKLVDDQALKHKIKDRIDNIELTPSGFVVHLGVNMDLSRHELKFGTIFFSPPEEIEDILNEVNYKMSDLGEFPDFNKICFGISIPSLHDKSLTPEGKHCLDIIVPCIPFNFRNNWMTGDDLSRGSDYKSLKEQFADVIIKAAEQVIPGLSENILQKDIATPITYNRYTLSSNGSWYDIAKVRGQKSRGPRSEVKGLYTTGNKSYPGSGVFGAAISGVFTAVAVSKKNFFKEINTL